MSDKTNEIQEEEKKKLSIDDLTKVSGGTMKDQIIITETTDISQDTEDNI